MTDRSPSNPIPLWRKQSFRRRVVLLIAVVLGVLILDLGMIALVSLRKVPKPPRSPVFNTPQVVQELMHMALEQPRDHDWPMRLGLALYDEGQYLSAIEALQQGLSLGAPEIAARRVLGLCYRALDRHVEALEQWERLAQLDPKALRVPLEKARELHLLDRTKEATALLNGISFDQQGFPTLLDADGRAAGLEQLAGLYAELGETARAAELASRVIRFAPERIVPRVIAGRISLEMGRITEALPQLRLAFRHDPRNSTVRFLYARALRAENSPANQIEIRQLLEGLVAAGEASGAVQFELAQLYERAKLYDKAAKAYVAAEQAGVRPTLSLERAYQCYLAAGMKEDGYYTRGRFYQSLGKPAEAIQAHSELVKMHDCCQSGYMHIAQVQLGIGKAKEARATLERAFRAGPPTPTLLAAMADVHHSLGDVRSEKAAWEQFIKADAENADVGYQHLAVLASRKGDLDEAERLFRKCIQLRPDADMYRQQQAITLLQRRNSPGRLAEAIEHLEQAVQLARSYPGVFYELGVAYRYAGRNQEAIWALRHAIDLDPGDGKPYTPLGQILIAEGRREEGQAIVALARRYNEFYQTFETLQARVKRSPRDVDAYRRLAVFYERTGAILDASNAYLEVLRLDPSDKVARERVAVLGRRRSQAVLGEWIPVTSKG